MDKATLYLNMIVGDFENLEIVKRSIDSVKDAVDGMYITVTYKDKEPDEESALILLLKEYKVNISKYKWTYNFSEARQYALDQVPKGNNVFVYWQDADDVLVDADKLHQVADEMVVNQESAIYFDYWYNVELDENGDVKEILIKHKRERIIRHNDVWKWIGDLHETLIEQQHENIIRRFRPDCHVLHLTDGQRVDHNIDRNIEILETAAKKQQHKDPRTLIYLAKAYLDKAKIIDDKIERKIKLDLALTLFHEYLAGSGTPGESGYQEPSGWHEERSTAWSAVAEIAILTGHPDIAVSAYQSAIDEAPWFPNYYVDLALTYTMLEDYKKAKHWLRVAGTTPEPETTIITLPKEMKTRMLEASFHINFHEQKLEWAKEDAEKLLELSPNDSFAQERVKTITSVIASNQAAQSIVYLGKYLQQIKEDPNKLAHLVQAIPNDLVGEKFAAEMRHLFLPPKKWKDNEITILCGPGFEQWDPTSIKTGLGGSEEAVVYLSNALTKLGWKVTVYANPKKPGVFNKVTYRVWHELNPKDEFNALILWRAIGFVDINPKAKLVMVWMHDMPNNPDFTEERVSKIDKIAVLSEYHKSQLRMQKDGKFIPIPDNKIFLTSNGIPDIQIPTEERNPHRVIYSSSADRGLQYLLKNWPKVKEKVTDAELHIFYGFEIFDKIHANNPARKQWKEQIFQMMKQDGIIYHGRVGHEELAKELAKSAIWAYPTDFTEISCITAMKAQQLGAIPVVTDYAALSETVKNGLRVDVDIRTEKGQEAYTEALVGLLQDEKHQEELREPMMKWAKGYFSWTNVAQTWDEKIRIVLQNPERKYATTNTKTEISNDSEQPSGDAQGDVRPVQGSSSGEEQNEHIGRSPGSSEGDRENEGHPGNKGRVREEAEN